jgi:hypothetical protein
MVDRFKIAAAGILFGIGAGPQGHAAPPAIAGQPTMADLRWHRRIVLLATDADGAPAFQEQRRILAGWDGAEERDVSVVEIDGDAVAGAADSARALRRRYDLPRHGFAVLLIGKDGQVALRSASPVTGATLTAAIDAMPMRREGLR